ncbi:MAG TPA: ABC transporter ATP-binding protein [Acidimicrobiales bacterium]|jgi:peptide/nickel transport system ATP-binding protein|nr:ABC transporter ATP-binding protein [Acidimicrobiales bacterium]
MSADTFDIQAVSEPLEGRDAEVVVKNERSEFVLEVSNFSVDYGVGDDMVRAVNDVTLHLRRSKVLGIAGESGSGKSTLVYAMTRLLRAPGVISGGDVILNVANPDDEKETTPINLVTASEKELRKVRWSHVSIVLQSALSALNPVLRVGREFDEVLKTHRPDMTKVQRRERAKELLAMVGLNEDRLIRFPHELSGGQRQRIMIALALALDPDLVIMDEPTTALDVVTQREIISELHHLRSRFGFAMIFITHDLSLLVELADEIVVMYAGEIVERAGARALYEAPRHPYTLGLLNSFPPLHGRRRELTGIPGSPPDLSDLPKGCNFYPRCPYAMSRCEHEAPALTTIGTSDRSVACWLHAPDPSVPVPVELSRTANPARHATSTQRERS